MSRLSDFKNKEIIDISSGAKVGYADDIIFDTDTAIVSSVVVYGRLRFFGLFGRDDDTLIDWNDIETIGTDTILIKEGAIKRPQKAPKTNYFDKIFG